MTQVKGTEHTRLYREIYQIAIAGLNDKDRARIEHMADMLIPIPGVGEDIAQEIMVALGLHITNVFRRHGVL